MTLITAGITIFALGSGIVFLYDFFVSVYEHFLHVAKKKWTSREQWEQAVYAVTKKWGQKCPTLRLKRERRYLLVDKVLGKSGKRMVQSWQRAGCLLGLLEGQDGLADATVLKQEYFSADGNWKNAPDKVDYGMMAYALLKALPGQADQLRPSMDQMVSCILRNRGADGTVSYSMGPDSPRRYVDTLGFVCPFLALYGTTYQQPEYIHLSVELLEKYQVAGCFRDVPFHCYRVDSCEPLGVYAWGRGTGWYMLGLIDSFTVIPDSAEKKRLEALICQIGDRCLDFQMEDGGFASILPEKSRYDSSATAMIGYFYAKAGVCFGNSAYQVAALRCEKRLMRATNALGMVDDCQGDTIDLGIFSDFYTFMPFAQGMTLRLARCTAQFNSETI